MKRIGFKAGRVPVGIYVWPALITGRRYHRLKNAWALLWALELVWLRWGVGVIWYRE
jgi:hypothetical protein